MEKEIFPILVVNNQNLKPYIEVFQYQPENITQQPLGVLVGFFEIREYSEDSAYVVNFLNSVLKKEYYLNSKRPVPESLDSALHKVNLALSELVKHGNINWLGKLDSAICVLDKNSIHFTATGNAKILLSRNNSLTNIAEGLSPELPEPHPLKTFINVSSGKLEKNDKIIISSDDLFHVLSTADLEKNIERFDREKFIQFLKTALTNELDLAGTIIIDVDGPLKIIPKKEVSSERSSRNLNVFSEKAFAKNKKKSNANAASKNEVTEKLPTIETLEIEAEYTDKKTGHIYIQGDNDAQEKSSPLLEQTQFIQDYIGDIAFSVKSFAGRKLSSLWKKIKKSSSKVIQYDYAAKISALHSILAEKRKEIARQKNEKLVTEKKNSASKIKPLKFFPNKPLAADSAIFAFKNKLIEALSVLTKIFTKLARSSAAFFSRLIEKKMFNFFKLFPNISEIKRLFLILSAKQKTFIAITLLAIIILPLAYSKINLNEVTPEPTAALPAAEISVNEKYQQEKNIVFIEQTEKIREISGVIDVFPLDGSLFAIGKDKITAMKDNDAREFIWPTEFGNGKMATYMSNLNLIFIVTDENKVISFSPVSLEIKENVINLPEDSKIDFASTYLTYLYFLDSKNDQIYRYPRAEGGFGEKTDWLKENIDLSMAHDMTIDDNVYLAIGSGIKRLFRGKNTEFSLEESSTPINFESVTTNITSNNIYVLDTLNSRLIHFDKEGKLIRQYFNEIISSATDFSVDEANKKVYVILPEEINAIKLEQ